MKHFKCPHCLAPQSHPECSLYSYLDCSSCGRLYRLADAIHFEGAKGAASQWWIHISSNGKTGPQTPCIYCLEGIPLQVSDYGSFIVPSRCPRCAKELPGPYKPTKEELEADQKRIAAEAEARRQRIAENEAKRKSSLATMEIERQGLIDQKNALIRENAPVQAQLESRLAELKANRITLSYAEFPFHEWYSKKFDSYLNRKGPFDVVLLAWIPESIYRWVASLILWALSLLLILLLLGWYFSDKDDAERALNPSIDPEISKIESALAQKKLETETLNGKIADVGKRIAELTAHKYQ